jgi:hypothetical protein
LSEKIQQEALMAQKAEEILRAIEGLPQDSLNEVKEFIDGLRKSRRKRPAAGRNGELLAKKQLAAIKKWAGRTLQPGFSGREHDSILYRDNG